ncbi:ABC transporter permease [Jatrophihabitans telluris]|uniref:ABC transporter permease n=1 Tax=Jatrophihabitans telluris TaxID=2038343 RepID=A0ABY4R283_9ACTN|nr:ABC transporter permease [Jatrophihabitans telluris]UQX89250.1 ABC transporter permease [Jatrophihabitans telluris]
MIRLSLRQFRTQGYLAIGLLGVAAIMLAATGPHFAHVYDAYAKAQGACIASPTCPNVRIGVSTLDSLLELIGTALVAVPALVGAFWGAPLISREFENGTHRLALTQSVTRTRWVAVKLAFVGAASVAATGLLSLMVTWWSAPMDAANMNRFDAGLFGERNITPLGYAAFAFALGVSFGVILRRALPAMAATLGVFLGVRLAFTYLIRQHLISPRHLSTTLAAITTGYGTNGGPSAQSSLFLSAPNLPNAWVYSTRAVDSSAHILNAHTVNSACPQLATASGPPSGASQVQASTAARDAFETCVTQLSATYHGVVTYQPASRYWLFQSYETGIYLAGALALVGLCFYWLHRHAT